MPCTSQFRRKCKRKSKIWETEREELLGIKVRNKLNFEYHIADICIKASLNVMPLPEYKRIWTCLEDAFSWTPFSFLRSIFML